MDEVISASKKYYSRFPNELWFICTAVGLGFVFDFSIGFYRFRLVDLVFVWSVLYFIKLSWQRHIEKKVQWLILLTICFIVVRLLIDYSISYRTDSLRVLLGMSFTFLTPIIYFVVRESRIDNKIVFRLLMIGCLISLLSQMGLLRWGEKELAGYVDLSRYINANKFQSPDLDYQERTITVWRAFSIGIAFAILFAKTKTIYKIISSIWLLLQIAGGGGSRGTFLYVLVAPIFILLLKRDNSMFGKKVFFSLLIGVLLATIYLWAPFGEKLAEKDNYSKTHIERATEISILFSEGWSGAERTGGFNARTQSYSEYIYRIFSSSEIFLWGVGESKGAAFAYVTNKQAHNMFLDIWGRSGIFGLFLFIIVNVFIISDLIKLLQASTISTKDKINVLAVAMALLYFYQPLMFQPVTSDRTFMIVFFLTAGLLKPLRRWVNGEFQQQQNLQIQFQK
ncbi:MAG: O-antigen ligase family protein [Ignavibacteriales bacterium]|nr:O-antigen ligase family protein [Ignavibacteriales bacterium]